MFRFLRHLLIGLLVLAAVFYGLGNIPFRVLVLAYIAHIVIGGLNLIWFAVIVGMIVLGASTRRAGFAAAPFVFAAIWLSAAVVQRTQVAASADPAIANRSVPADLRTIRTLIFDEQGEGCCGQFKLLADGMIDRYVFSHRNDNTGVRDTIFSYRLAQARECSAEEMQRSSLLTKAGRTDECFAREQLADLPDGLILRLTWMRFFTGIGCCNQGHFIERKNGVETERATWYSGQRLVLSYLPLFGFAAFSEPTDLWGTGGGGGAQLVWIGGPRFQSRDMTAAVYDIRWDDPISTARVSPGERLARAQALAQRSNFGERLSAIDIGKTLADEGQISEDLIRLMALFVELDTAKDKISKFWFKLSEPQRQVFADAVMARIQNPLEGYPFTRLNFAFIPRLPAGSPLRQQAENLYADRRDLKVWQYEVALKLAEDPKAMYGTPAYAEQQRRFFRMLLDDGSPGFTSRGLAFLARYVLRTDEERQAFGERLDLVPDAQVDEMVRRNWYRTVNTTVTTEATRAFRGLALARIERIADDKLRRETQEHFRNRADN